jgi:hypothetical protein
MLQVVWAPAPAWRTSPEPFLSLPNLPNLLASNGKRWQTADGVLHDGLAERRAGRGGTERYTPYGNGEPGKDEQ